MPQILEKGQGILRVSAGTATFDSGEEVQLFYGAAGQPIVTFEDGTTIYWSWEELLDEAIKLKNHDRG